MSDQLSSPRFITFEGYVAQDQGRGLHMDGTTPTLIRTQAPSDTFRRGQRVLVVIVNPDERGEDQ